MSFAVTQSSYFSTERGKCVTMEVSSVKLWKKTDTTKAELLKFNPPRNPRAFIIHRAPHFCYSAFSDTDTQNSLKNRIRKAFS